jgi:23S rRNA A1618 N6-methylase RlmF
MYKTTPDSADVGNVKVLQTEEQFFKFLTKLKAQSIMAIDLEHSSQNSKFIPWVCMPPSNFIHVRGLYY